MGDPGVGGWNDGKKNSHRLKVTRRLEDGFRDRYRGEQER